MDWVQISLNAIVCAAASGAAVYFREYMRKKGENRATREDVQELTRKVESVKDQYAQGIAKLTSSLTAQTSLRMLAGERRLATHQDAYTRWHGMIVTAHSPNGQSYADECMVWWRENALFLDAEPRARFFDAANAARLHYTKIEVLRGSGPDAAQEILNNMKIVRRAGPAIVRACELPALKADDGSDVLDGSGFGTPGIIQLPPTGKE